jgi:AcrR family transcriptional regulator
MATAPSPAPEAVRRRVLEIASRTLTSGGPGALTVRDVAAAAGCSTMMIYTLFGGKAPLVESVYRDGFERLQASLARVTECDPLERLRRLARAYRDFGLNHRTLYAAMFSRPIASPNLRGNPARLEDASFGTLLEAVRYARDAGALGAAHTPQTVADALWSAVHGGVSLEISGHFSDDAAAADARFDALIDICLTGLREPSFKERKR